MSVTGIRWNRIGSALGALLLVLATAAPALAQEPTHDGFYLRLSTGGGYGSMSYGEAAAETSIKSPTWMLDVTPGWFVSRNLAVGANVFLSSEVSPSITVAGRDAALSSSVDLFSFGAAATYFIDPMNLFASLSAGVAWVHQNDTSDPGLALNLLFGKEWWVSPRWGVGLAGNFYYAHTSYAGTGINSVGGGISFSASYSSGLAMR
jgi:hypothetical protein